MGAFPATATCTTHISLLEPASLVSGNEYQLAKTYWLPDYQSIYNSNINAPDVSGPFDGGDDKRRCEDYGLVSACESGASGTLQRPLPNLRCYANCRCADVYQYDDNNCQPPYYTSGNSCGGKYSRCELNVEEACEGYVKSCASGWQLSLDGRCEYMTTATGPVAICAKGTITEKSRQDILKRPVARAARAQSTR